MVIEMFLGFVYNRNRLNRRLSRHRSFQFHVISDGFIVSKDLPHFIYLINLKYEILGYGLGFGHKTWKYWDYKFHVVLWGSARGACWEYCGSDECRFKVGVSFPSFTFFKTFVRFAEKFSMTTTVHLWMPWTYPNWLRAPGKKHQWTKWSSK